MLKIKNFEKWNQDYKKILALLKKFGTPKNTSIDSYVMEEYSHVLNQDSLISIYSVEVRNSGFQLSMYGTINEKSTVCLGFMLNMMNNGGAASIGYYLNKDNMIVGTWNTNVRHKISFEEVKYSKIEMLGKTEYSPEPITIYDDVNEVTTGSFELVKSLDWEKEIKSHFNSSDKNNLNDLISLLTEIGV